ncbi:unnamed protein product [Amaranthus hypochondriacus]
MWPPDISEISDALFDVELAIRLGFSYIQLEGDNVNVMKAITNNSKGCSPSFLLLDRLQSLILAMSGFQSSVVRRSGNSVAHLASGSLEFSSLGETIFMHPFSHHLVSLATVDII